MAVSPVGADGCVATDRVPLGAESPTPLVATTRYVYDAASVSPVSVNDVTPAPTVPAAVQVPLLFVDRSTRKPASPATSVQARATAVSDCATAEVSIGWPAKAGVTADAVA